MSKIPSAIRLAAKSKNLIAYKKRGSDRIYYRTKGSLTKKKIKTEPAFANTRKVNAEFGGRSTAVKWLMKPMIPLKHIMNYSVAGALNSKLAPIQKSDTTGDWGKRSILISRDPQLLQGLNLNNRNLMESIIQTDFTYTLSRDSMSAKIMIPALLPNINFFNPGDFPLYRITTILATVPDVIFVKDGYKPVNGTRNLKLTTMDTNWVPFEEGAQPCECELILSPCDMSSRTLMLLVGISFGANGFGNYVRAAKYTGAGKIFGLL
jgi:hypothetical protein